MQYLFAETPWGEKKFRVVIERMDRPAPDVQAEIDAWEALWCEYQMASDATEEHRQERAQILAGVNDYVSKVLKQLRVDRLLDAADRKCYICGCTLGEDEGWNMDHVFPKSFMRRNLKGVANRLGNMMPTHSRCNTAKAHRMPTKGEVSRARKAYNIVGWPFLTDCDLGVDIKHFSRYVESVKA